MPYRTLIGLVAALLVAQSAASWPDLSTAGTCDRAAQRAALSHGVPLDVLRAISRVETGRALDGQLAPWPWTINVEGKGFWFDSEQERTRGATRYEANLKMFDQTRQMSSSLMDLLRK